MNETRLRFDLGRATVYKNKRDIDLYVRGQPIGNGETLVSMTIAQARGLAAALYRRATEIEANIPLSEFRKDEG